jgi:hypothetical protein
MSPKQTCIHCKNKFTNDINKLFHTEFCQLTKPVDIFTSNDFISSVNEFNETVNKYNNTNLPAENLDSFVEFKKSLITIGNTLIYKNIDDIQLVSNTNMLFKILNQMYNSNNEQQLKEFFQMFIKFCKFELEFEYQTNYKLFYNVFNKHILTNCSDKKIFIKLNLFKLFMENNTQFIQNTPFDKIKLITHIYDLLICDNSVEPEDMDDFFLQIYNQLNKYQNTYYKNQ